MRRPARGARLRIDAVLGRGAAARQCRCEGPRRRDGGLMSLSTAEGASDQGRQTIALPRLPGDDSVLLGTMVPRSSAKHTRRAVLYVHCLGDPYVQPDLATWYLQRGFHFYVAELRTA